MTENQYIGLFLVSKIENDQANKSARGMPWHQEPMKDVISCDKLRGAANKPRSVGVRMGKPTKSKCLSIHI